MEMQYIATPWKEMDYDRIADANEKYIVGIDASDCDGNCGCIMEWTPETRKLIVRVVNAHESLLEAAKRLLATTPRNDYSTGHQDAIQELSKAIKQAEGK